MYLWHLLPLEPDQWLGTREWWRLALGGLMLYALGYAVFAVSSRVAITPTGVANRVGAVAVIGVAVCMVGVLGAAATAVGRTRLLYTGLLTSIAVCSLLTITVLGQQWTRSYAIQQEVLAALADKTPDLPADSVVILAGVCPYEGAAVVFESHWDFAGAMQVRYGRPDLRGDVIRQLQLGNDAVRTKVYGSVRSYPFDDGLQLWDADDRRLVALDTRSTAVRALGEEPSQPDCAPGRPGRGALVRPGDRLPGALVDATRRLLGG